MCVNFLSCGKALEILQYLQDEGGNIVTVDDWIKFKASRSTVSLVKVCTRI